MLVYLSLICPNYGIHCTNNSWLFATLYTGSTTNVLSEHMLVYLLALQNSIEDETVERHCSWYRNSCALKPTLRPPTAIFMLLLCFVAQIKHAKGHCSDSELSLVGRVCCLSSIFSLYVVYLTTSCCSGLYFIFLNSTRHQTRIFHRMPKLLAI